MRQATPTSGHHWKVVDHVDIFPIYFLDSNMPCSRPTMWLTSVSSQRGFELPRYKQQPARDEAVSNITATTIAATGNSHIKDLWSLCRSLILGIYKASRSSTFFAVHRFPSWCAKIIDIMPAYVKSLKVLLVIEYPNLMLPKKTTY